MTNRPLSVKIISGLFIAAGLVGFTYHATEFKTLSPFPFELVWVCLVRLLAIVFGVGMLYAKNWARWGLLLWIAYHVGLSALHSAGQTVVHGLLFALIALFLLRPNVSAYFRANSASSESPRPTVG